MAAKAAPKRHKLVTVSPDSFFHDGTIIVGIPTFNEARNKMMAKFATEWQEDERRRVTLSQLGQLRARSRTQWVQHGK